MDKEKLNTATTLNNKIEKLEKQLEYWQRSKALSSTLQLDVQGESGWINADTENINFSVLKSLTIQNLLEQIADLKEKFKNL